MIFPEYPGQKYRYSYWNTNEWAQKLAEASEKGLSQSPYLNPGRKERLSEHAKRVLSADVLYGGYLEDRSFLWKGSYMEPSKFLHLGIDFVAPAESIVVASQPMWLTQVYNDTPEEAGWGTRLIFTLDQHPDTHLVYGHLRPEKFVHQAGTLFEPGHVIGHLGSSEQNGGWSPHLHVQAIYGTLGGFGGFLDQPASLDGYGELNQIAYLALRFPDPMRFLTF